MKGRVLVTGGGTGIGRGIAAALVAAGYAVVVNGRRRAPLLAVAEALGATPLVGDVTADPAGLVAAAGPLSHLVNNAGHHVHAPLGGWTAQHFASLYAVHVTAPALLSQAFAAQAGRGASVVNVASTLAERPAPGAGPYGAAKAGMVALTRQLALELAGRGIRANAVLPGVVPTAMTADARGEASGEARQARLLGLHPLGRLGAPADVARAVVWLVESDWVTGAAVPVDGGLLVRE